MEQWVAHYGCPKVIRCDRGLHNRGVFYAEMTAAGVGAPENDLADNIKHLLLSALQAATAGAEKAGAADVQIHRTETHPSESILRRIVASYAALDL